MDAIKEQRDRFFDLYRESPGGNIFQTQYDGEVARFWKTVGAENAGEINAAYRSCCTDDGKAVKKADEYSDRWYTEWLAASYEAFSGLVKKTIEKYAGDWQLDDVHGLWMTFSWKPEFYSGKNFLAQNGHTPKAWTDLELYKGILGATLAYAREALANPDSTGCEPNAMHAVTKPLVVTQLNGLTTHPSLKPKVWKIFDDDRTITIAPPTDFLRESGRPGAKLLYKLGKALHG